MEHGMAHWSHCLPRLEGYASAPSRSGRQLVCREVFGLLIVMLSADSSSIRRGVFDRLGRCVRYSVCFSIVRN